MKIKLPSIKAVPRLLKGKAIKYSPEIKLGLGIGCIVAATVAACMASRKVDEVLAVHDGHLAKIHSDANTGVTEASETKKHLAREYASICLDMVKLYGPSVLLLGGGIYSVCSSHVEMKGRNSALVAMNTSLGNLAAAYRDKIIETLGPDEEEKIRLGVAKNGEQTEPDENGEVRELYSKIADPKAEFSVYFDESTSKLWERSDDYNWSLINSVERTANTKWQAEGKGGIYMLMNIIDALGMHHIVYKDEYKHFLTAGWIEGKGEPYISCGARQVQVVTHDRDGEPYSENKILLTFNCNKEPVWMNF